MFFFSENLFEAKKIEGLKMGAVDFFSFTSSLPETELRLRTLLTHLHRKIQKTNKDKDDLNFIPEGNLLIRGTKKRRLTAREFGIIKALNDSFPNVVCRDKIISLVNNMDGDSERVIDVHISSLRKKVRDLDILIRTIRGKGYVLEFP